MDIILNIILSLVFTALGVILALWYENLGSARLYFSSMETTDSTKPNNTRVRFLHIKIKNTPLKRKFVTRQTAYSCHGTITFLTMEEKQVGCTIPIKWDGTPEPVKFEISNDNKLTSVLDPALFRLTRYIDIPPDEEESLALAIKMEGDDWAYGWTVNSYLHNWRYPDCVLPPAEYKARVRVITGDGTFEKDILFTNPVNFEGFDLKPEPPKRNFFQKFQKKDVKRKD